MQWIDESKKAKPKGKMQVVDPSKVVKKKKPKTAWVMKHNEVERSWTKKDLDSIPPGTLCQVRKNNQRWAGFDYCTVIRLYHPDGGSGKMLWAEVMDFDGKIHNINTLYLRNDNVQNGNVEEEE
jgi:hypothetical protein